LEEDLIGRDIHELQFIESSLLDRMCLRLDEEMFSIEGNVKKKGGTVFPARISVGHCDGGYVIVLNDLGELRRAQRYIYSMAQKDVEELRMSKEYSEMLLRKVPVPVVIFDENGVRKYVNESFENLFGFKRGELMGTALEELYPKCEAEKVRDTFELCKKNGFSACETVAKKKDGSRASVMINFSFIDKSREILGVSVDIGSLKRAQEYTKKLMDKVPVPMSILDSEGKRVEVNEAFEKFYMYSKKEVIDLPLESLYPEKHRETLKRAMKQCVDSGYSSCEVEVVRGDGTVVPVIINFSHLTDIEGRPRIMGTATDISASRERENELKNVLDNIPAAVWRSSREKRCVYINDEFTRLLGWTEKDLIGLRYDEAPCVCNRKTSLCDSTWREVMERVWKAIDAGERPEPFEIPLMTKSGRVVVHRAVEIPLDSGALWISVDITREKISRQ
jgi:PAS domain S-box-containing protein